MQNVLFVCSVSRNRSRTAEILTWFGGWKARCVGTDPTAVHPVTSAAIWEADFIVTMEAEHADYIKSCMAAEGKVVFNLDIPDIYQPFEPDLCENLMAQLSAYGVPETAQLANILQKGYERYCLLHPPVSKATPGEDFFKI